MPVCTLANTLCVRAYVRCVRARVCERAFTENSSYVDDVPNDDIDHTLVKVSNQDNLD